MTAAPSPITQPCPVPGSRPKLQTVVRHVTDSGIVEFDFIYGDPDLSVELVLPIAAFKEFCLENGCLVTAADPAASHAVLRLVKDGPAVAPVSVGASQ
ncbi:phenol hydroxylase subunit [Brevundimonas diminuta]|uniref:phenol hydroxylase subunit n=1 Tax=Brevundimonas diminuta TaxID=293 RepID=UPI0025A5E32B|nr:phenol hydroxylase subunit [Brevundimonas diminuta]MDM8351274.1 phenol hydroxylase subunit [Brevundimonas diminuta]